MNNTETIKKNYEFSRIYNRGKYSSTKYLVLYVMPCKEKDIKRIGITISKKTGKSVVRNRIRRLIKENYRMIEQNIKNGYEIVFVARKTDELPEYKEIRKEMNYLFRKSGLFNRENGN